MIRAHPSPALGSSIIDFQGVAGLIDAVLAAAPERLPTLLGVLSSSSERLEAQVVLDIVVRCRDPLAPLETLCRDSLKAAADLDAILNPRRGKNVADVCPPGRANAILNLCDAALRDAGPHTGKRRKRIRVIRPEVKVAAVQEMNYRQEDIERISQARDGQLPHLWLLLGRYLVRTKRANSSIMQGLPHQTSRLGDSWCG